MRDGGKIIKNKEKEHFGGKMAPNMLVNGIMIRWKEKEQPILQMVQHILATG